MLDDQKLKQHEQMLKQWAQAIILKIDDFFPDIWSSLESNDPLPQGCPSKASLAAMSLSEINKPLREVNAIYDEIRKHLFEKYG